MTTTPCFENFWFVERLRRLVGRMGLILTCQTSWNTLIDATDHRIVAEGTGEVKSLSVRGAPESGASFGRKLNYEKT
jgi:hypothetical protein